MFKHKSEDYKITAVKYYLENDTNYTKTCEIFKCSERSLKRWIERYKELEEINRLDRKSISYKITKKQVKYAIEKLKENEQISMERVEVKHQPYALHKNYIK
jgi:transposase